MNLQLIIYPFTLLLVTVPLLSECGLSLTLTSVNQRVHVCPNETLVATCSEGIGRELEWNYNGTQFLFNDNDAELPDATLNTLSATPATVYLISRTNEENETFRYTSQLSVAVVTFDFVNITCTVKIDPIDLVGAQSDSLLVQTSVSPNKPVLKADWLRCVGQDGNRSTQYLLEWMPPDNIMDFDLAHYEVQLMGPNTMNKVLLCINTTAIVSLNPTVADMQSVAISIVAVTQCGQRGAAMERSVQLGTCQSPASSSLNLNLIPLWAMLIIIAGTSTIINK